MRRKDREMDESFSYQLLDKCDYVTLSLIEPEGTPYGVPIQVLRKEDIIYIHSAKVGHKLDCLKQNPQVCVSCVDDVVIVPEELTTKYKSAIFRGIASEITDAKEKTQVLYDFCEKFTPSHLHLVPSETSAHLSATSIWKISIREVSGKEHK